MEYKKIITLALIVFTSYVATNASYSPWTWLPWPWTRSTTATSVPTQVKPEQLGVYGCLKSRLQACKKYFYPTVPAWRERQRRRSWVDNGCCNKYDGKSLPKILRNSNVDVRYS